MPSIWQTLADYCYEQDLAEEWEHDDMYFQLVEKYGHIIHYNPETQYYNVVHEDFKGIEFLTQEEAIEYAYEHMIKK